MLDLFSEMNAGKVIVINTAKDLLKEQGTEIFGRFFIAMIAQAAQERATLPEDCRVPTFVYIDEAGDYLGLLPPSAICSVPTARMGDERHIIGLVGKLLNASDELSAAAVASDTFKSIVTGEPVEGRDV